MAHSSSKPQKHLSAIINVDIKSMLFESADATMKARLNSTTNVFSSAWTSTIESQNNCAVITPAQIRLLFSFRIGKTIYSQEEICKSCTGKMSDRLGHHDATCPGLNRTKRRHDAVRDELFTISKEAGFLPQKEVLRLLDDSGVKPADILIPDYKHGKACCFDIVISSPFAHVQESAKEVGYVMKEAEKFKNNKYNEKCTNKGYLFSPFAMDIFGGMSKSCNALINRLSLALSDKNNVPVWLSKIRIRQRLVSTAQKYVALALQCRIDH